jgi:plastocyanin
VISSSAFGPASITVSVGTTVTWRNNDGVAHTATSDAGTWDTGNIPGGGSASRTFSTAGSFPYHCTFHSGMRGTVVVQ